MYLLTFEPVLGWNLMLLTFVLYNPSPTLRASSASAGAYVGSHGGRHDAKTYGYDARLSLVAAPTSPPHRTGFPDVPVSP